MDINILEFVEGAGKATGVTVIIDVFRAFSVGCYAYDAGAAGIVATGSVEDAFKLKLKYPEAVLVGERDENKIPGFDHGNSPTEILESDLRGKLVIHTTTAGTKGVVNAVNADLVLGGSLVNAEALAMYIKSLNPKTVSLVAMGFRATESADEDLLCATLIADRLKGKMTDFSQQIADLRYSSGKRFFDPANIEYSPPTDFFLCTMTNKFNFVLKALKRPDGNADLIKMDL
jgi:2-phosphosulfolactate phosphatase